MAGGSAALITNQNISLDTNDFKRGLALVGPGSATNSFQLLIASSPSGDFDQIRKLEVGDFTTPPTTMMAGVRSTDPGGVLRDSTDTTSDFMPDLVPSINDAMVDLAYNPGDNLLYFLSRDTTAGDVFLSAVSFDWGLTDDNSLVAIEDLDPDSANSFLDLTYIASLNPNDMTGEDLDAARGLSFSPDGSVLYITNGTGDGSSNRVFIFDLAQPANLQVPEPSSILLMSMMGIAALLSWAVLRRRN